MFDKRCKCLMSLIVSIIIAIIVGVISFTTFIPGLLFVILIALILGVGAIALIFIAAIQAHGRDEMCVCKYGSCIAIGAVGTIITTIIGLAITIVTGVLGISILIGLGTLFLTFTILSVLEFLLCLVKVNCKCRE